MLTSLILKIILQTLAVAIAMLVSVLDYVVHDKNSPKFKSMCICLFILSGFFLVGSILITVVDTNDNNHKEKNLRDQLGDVQSQNLKLQNTISILSEDQKSRFDSLFEEQNEVAAETAQQINASADRLHWSIEDSITILKKSSNEIDRAVNPIKELRISWVLANSLETTTGDAYRKRILKGISELIIHPGGLRAMGDVYSANDVYGDRIVISKAPYTPDKKNEEPVYFTMSCAFLSLDFFKKAVPIDALISNKVSPDLHINVAGDAINSFNNKVSSYDSFGPHVALSYELDSKDFVLSAGFLAPSYLNNATGKIISIPDLDGAQLVVRVGGGYQGVFDQNKDTTGINLEIKHINRTAKIRKLKIRMSEGRELVIKGAQMTRHTDKNGDTFFVYKFPRRI